MNTITKSIAQTIAKAYRDLYNCFLGLQTHLKKLGSELQSYEKENSELLQLLERLNLEQNHMLKTIKIRDDFYREMLIKQGQEIKQMKDQLKAISIK